MCHFSFFEKYYLNRHMGRLDIKAIVEWYELSQVYNSFRWGGEINNIVIGSSHGAYGLISSIIFDSKYSINLCTDSQDLYTSCKILEMCLNEHSVKNVVMTYSLFSNSYMLDMVKSERNKCYLNNIFFNVERRIKNSSYDIKYTKLIKLYIKYYLENKHYTKIYRNEYGDKIQRLFFDNDMSVEQRVKGHIKHNKRNNNENIWLEIIIEMCKKRNISLNVVIMPVRTDYRKEVYKYGTYSEFFNNIIQISKKTNTSLYSFFNDVLEDEYFGDFDHLNYNGAAVVSENVQKLIEERV